MLINLPRNIPLLLAINDELLEVGESGTTDILFDGVKEPVVVFIMTQQCEEIKTESNG